ncbi:MAG: oxidoreductase, coenzyme F420-dependent [Cypionkella sp.]|uniref:NADPH-dependent F420 reductase n=1 Tax=Cypionkella sp. TaxID=2811411 RepID=UPI0026131DE1|nr:NAD(P)-binding domain-containing protein [Cypionkella sp.]MDB5660520.1 oxidoreductase, coenzyme F420-dependent [Cypionkella sp.]
MKIGIVGAGNIGALLARKFAAAGHSVKLSNSRGPDSLADAVRGTSVRAVSNEDAPKDVDVVILSVPFAKNPDVAKLLANAPSDAIVVDTSNYYPARDGTIAEVDAGKPETVWVSEQVERPLVKAWNAILSQTLAEAGTATGTANRIAIPIAGDDAAAKKAVAELMDISGFDTVDAGTLAESWRFQPGTPAYCTELTTEELALALADASKDQAPKNRDAIMQAIASGKVEFTRHGLASNNRVMSA